MGAAGEPVRWTLSQGTPPLRVSRLEGSAVGIKEPLAREGFHATPFNAGNPRTGVAPQVEEVALLQCVGLFPRQTAPAAKWRDFGLGNAC